MKSPFLAVANLRPLACHAHCYWKPLFFAIFYKSLCDNEQQFSVNSKLFSTNAKNPQKPLHPLHRLHGLQVITRIKRVITSGQKK
jgi:hypothetical protein